MTRGTDVTNLTRVYREPTGDAFPETLTLQLSRETRLRYGENPNQKGVIYRPLSAEPDLAALTNIRLAKTGKAGLSATNYLDITRALELLKFFPRPSVAVMKHLLPSGFARQTYNESMDELYRRARDADARSAFGSLVVFNREVNLITAGEIMTTFVEGVAAPAFTEEALARLEEKKDLRVVLYDSLDSLPRFQGDSSSLIDARSLPTGRFLVQEPYLSSIRSVDDLVLDPLVRATDGSSFVVDRDPTPRELEDMLTAWYVNIGVRSNGIVIVKNGVTLSIGSGQQERVGAVEQALVKAYQKAMDRYRITYDPLEGAKDRHKLRNNPLAGAVVSSDAFFPFRDSIDLLARCGVSAVIQPGGSKKDSEVIQAANEHAMAMAFTKERCFAHF